MKFGKSLSNQIEETLPEWRDKFLSYKDLKKRLNLIGDGDGDQRSAKRARAAAEDEEGPADAAAAAAAAMAEEVEDFLKLLEDELEKFNAFFVEKEEDYIIRQKELQDIVARVVARDCKDELMMVRKEIVDFHGEMVLLENYSALNYTGLVKILKKYDKRTGALIRLPFIQKVLQQPFFTTDLIYKLVKECEAMLDRFFHKNEPSLAATTVNIGDGDDGISAEQQEHVTLGSSASLGRDGDGGGGSGSIPELEEIKHMKSHYMKSTVAALRALKEIRSGSSTVNAFSLPPLQQSNNNNNNNMIPIVVEQEVAE